MFYYADEFQPQLVSHLACDVEPKRTASDDPPDKYYGIGTVNYHPREMVVQFQRHKRRKEIAQLLEALLEKHPKETIYLAWDNVNTHEDDEVEAVT